MPCFHQIYLANVLKDTKHFGEKSANMAKGNFRSNISDGWTGVSSGPAYARCLHVSCVINVLYMDDVAHSPLPNSLQTIWKQFCMLCAGARARPLSRRGQKFSMFFNWNRGTATNWKYLEPLMFSHVHYLCAHIAYEAAMVSCKMRALDNSGSRQQQQQRQRRWRTKKLDDLFAVPALGEQYLPTFRLSCVHTLHIRLYAESGTQNKNQTESQASTSGRAKKFACASSNVALRFSSSHRTRHRQHSPEFA